MMPDLPRYVSKGVFFLSDPHLAGSPPGQRREGFMEQMLDKVQACLNRARELDMLPVVLGDLFHLPRDNPNTLLVALIDLFRDHHPLVLVGNHDKYQARYTSDVSMAVLDAAGVIQLMAEPGPQALVEVGGLTVLLGASPDMSPLPGEVDPQGADIVLWATHHNIGFPDYLDKPVKTREIPGVDWVVNGHIHQPQPTITHGRTRWANPGSLARMTFSRRVRERIPQAAIWTPSCQDSGELEMWTVPHLPFEQVFPDQELPDRDDSGEEESGFLRGLERLSWRRTTGGWGLRQFLDDNLDKNEPEADLIWSLYKEITNDDA